MRLVLIVIFLLAVALGFTFVLSKTVSTENAEVQTNDAASGQGASGSGESGSPNKEEGQ